MTENRAAPRAAAMRHVADTAPLLTVAGTALLLTGAGTALLLTGVLLAACSSNGEGGAGSTLRVYAADVTGNAKACEVPKVSPVAGQTTEAAIKVGNDGGWCGLRIHQDGPKPFAAGLLMTRASHGSVVIHTVGDDTRIDYTPDRGFTGTDSFVVKLVPGDAAVQVGVTVMPAAT